jgi:hypothetical protein
MENLQNKTKDQLDQEDIWKPIEKLDFNDINIFWYIDTRDFHFLTLSEIDIADDNLQDKICKLTNAVNKINYSEIQRKRKESRYFFGNCEELKKLILKIYEETDGDVNWRMLVYKDRSKDDNCNFKYLRIFNSEFGLIVCDAKFNPIMKEVLKFDITSSENLRKLKDI